MKKALKSDWKTVDLSGKTQEFTLNRSIPQSKSEDVQRGFIPQTINDRWFIYAEKDKIYIHNSWSGTCRYIISICKSKGKVLLSKFMAGGITSTEINSERKTINKIIDTVLLKNIQVL